MRLLDELLHTVRERHSVALPVPTERPLGRRRLKAIRDCV